MSEVYLLYFAETGDEPLVYASEKKAKAVLWAAYQKDCVPMMKQSDSSEEDIAELMAQDKHTFEEYGYIEDYGWITHCFVDEGED